MMPAQQSDLCEFLSDLENVVTLLQAQRVYLVSSPPDADVWAAERTMLVWKDTANAWQFKMQLLGEQYQGAFDASIDRNIIQRLGTLENNPKTSDEISEGLGQNLRAQISRPCLRLSNDQQNKVIAVLKHAWLVSPSHSAEKNIKLCLALLHDDMSGLSEDEHQEINGFKNYLTLDRLKVLYGASSQHIYDFCVTRNTTTLADILKFIQLLSLASLRKLGHTDAIELPALPEGSDVVYGSRPDEHNDIYRGYPALHQRLLPPITPQMQAAVVHFDAAFTALENSEVALSDQDRQLMARSKDALNRAKNTWIDSFKRAPDVITFRRATDKVLQEEHIQRLYMHQRLGLFGGTVETEELQKLRLSLRDLRDFSDLRWLTSDVQIEITRVSLIMFGCYAIIILLLAGIFLITGISGSLELILLLSSHIVISHAIFHVGFLSVWLNQVLINGFFYGFSYDLWNAHIEAAREFLFEIFPRSLAVVVGVSLSYGLFFQLSIAADLMMEIAISAVQILLLNSIIVSGFLAICGLFNYLPPLIGRMSAYMTELNQWFHGPVPAEDNMFVVNSDESDEVVPEEGSGLTPT